MVENYNKSFHGNETEFFLVVDFLEDSGGYKRSSPTQGSLT